MFILQTIRNVGLKNTEEKLILFTLFIAFHHNIMTQSNKRITEVEKDENKLKLKIEC